MTDAALAALLVWLLVSSSSRSSSRDKLTIGELRELAARMGFPDPRLAAAIAMAESSGIVKNVGDRHLGVSIGLWQINMRAHPQFSRSELETEEGNARAALVVSRNGTNWRPWSAYRERKHVPFL